MAERFRTSRLEPPNSGVTKYQHSSHRSLHVAFDKVTSRPNAHPGEKSQGNPWLAMGRDGQWSLQTTASVVSSVNRMLFVTVVIVDPQKWAVIFDGAEGVRDHPEMWIVR
ncbi:MAG: hypothetical protein TREMPRED_003307 [Tremellales sp. Tagirdzhanova-0007]|nr:MAG: hypothetical protein TREMPRED_003307 [Tremellales sp. Tagirdzhanova-0007]